jgi:Cu2+-exporting ATPase
MDVPITLAIALAVGTSLYETMMSGHHAYFDAAIMLCFFLLGGRYLDHRTRASARSAAQELAALEVPRALRVTANGEETVAAADLAVGDIVRVKPGGRIPVDGIVTEGQSELDRSLMTGESLPVYAGPGMAVSAGEVNLTGPLMVEVRAAGRDTSLHRIADLVAVAESGRANYNSLADRAAKLYAPGVHILSVLAAAGWWIATQDLRIALNIAAAVLIITCPCALGLAVPAVTTAASGRLFRKGLLIKDGTALERLAEADTVVFDKTGTLTTGTSEPVGLEDHPQDTLRVALALAEGSSHPLAEALARRLARPWCPGGAGRGPARGAGLRGRRDLAGARGPAGPCGLGRGGGAGGDGDVPEDCRRGTGDVPVHRDAARRRGGNCCGPEGRRAARDPDLGRYAGRGGGLRHRIGIDEVIAEALPQEKAALVADLSSGGARVLMVGDGLNDTAALAAAHVSIAPASALDAARTASDMVLMGRSLAPVADACTTATSAAGRIRENFTIATVYNVLAVPLAIAGLATPLIAALAMSMSSITVSLNALRLK